MNNKLIGVLLMAYGTPENLDQVEAYFTQIRGGKTPPPAAVENLRERYIRVGGSTPLSTITQAVRSELEKLLNAEGARYKVYVGMKHWHPFIGAVIPQMVADGIEEMIAVPLAPHYSRISIGGYRKGVDEALAKLAQPLKLVFVDNWHMEPQFLDLIAAHLKEALNQFPVEERPTVLPVFSAHSLPIRIREWNDPYESQLQESCAAVAARLGLTDWRFAWQSAGGTTEPWLGPDILDYLVTLKAEGIKNVLQVPIGFVSDHLEILNDIDIEAKDKAKELGMTLHRTALPNVEPAYIQNLATIVTKATAKLAEEPVKSLT